MLDQLGKVQTNGKPELLARVINLYLVESPKLMQKLKQAAGASDAPEIARTAHSLKSSSANVGAKVLSRLLRGPRGVGAPRRHRGSAQDLRRKSRRSMARVQTALNEEFELLAASKV